MNYVLLGYCTARYLWITFFWAITQRDRHELRSSGILHSEIHMNYVLLDYYAGSSSGNSLPTFRDNQSVSSSGFQKPSRKLGPMVCPETSVRSYRHSLCNSPEEQSSHAVTSSFVAKKKCHRKTHLLLTSHPLVILEIDKCLVWLRACSQYINENEEMELQTKRDKKEHTET